MRSTAATAASPRASRARRTAPQPLSRPLFIYAKQEAFERPEVEAFVRYLIENETEIAEASQFVPLTDEQIEKANADLEAAVARSFGLN